MPVDLRELDREFADDAWPDILCPFCMTAMTRPEPGSIAARSSAESSRIQTHEAWEPDWISGHFTGYLRCSDPNCDESTAVAGKFSVGLTRTYDDYQDYYALKFAYPALPLCSFPPGTPDTVQTQLERAGAVLWSDPQSAANSLRRAVEALIDAQSIPRVTSTTQGKPRTVSLHERIGLLAAKQPSAGEALEAVKWVGNEGSHSASDLSATDCIDLAEFLAYALRALYDQTEQELLARARTINAAKGRTKPSGTLNP